MEQKQLKETLKQYGYTMRFGTKGMTLSNQETKCKGTTITSDAQLKVVFSTIGPKPSDDILNLLIAHFEEEAAVRNRTLSFQTVDFHYIHPDYYKTGTIHSKSIPHDALIVGDKRFSPLFKALYEACLEEEQKDPYFEWNFQHSYVEIKLDFVKTTYTERVHFLHKGDTFSMRVGTSYEPRLVEDFETAEECVQRWKELVKEIDHQHRLHTLYAPSDFYTKRFLGEIDIYNMAATSVYDQLRLTHSEEELECYFKQLTKNQLIFLRNKAATHTFLVRLLNTWVLKNKVANDLLFFEKDEFDEALLAYQQRVFQSSITNDTANTIAKLKTSS